MNDPDVFEQDPTLPPMPPDRTGTPAPHDLGAATHRDDNPMETSPS